MIIAGLEKFTTLDYPGHLSALIYTYGCTLKCPFCHNPELVIGKFKDVNKISIEEVLKFLKSRIGKLEALAITGGEPTLHPDLVEFIKQVRDLGFKVKLDTYGLEPKRVRKIADLNIVDYWAMDVKGNEQTYAQCGYKQAGGDVLDKVNKSIDIIMNSGADYEFRTTLLKSRRWHTEDIIRDIANRIKGAKNYYLQNFRATKTLDTRYQGHSEFSFTHLELEKFKEIIVPFVQNVGIRA